MVNGRTRSGARREQAERTRTRLLDVAERLYAERGLAQVSNRLVAEEAGQANNSAVAYHIGTKADLVEALCVRLSEPVSRMTNEMVEACRGSDAPRDHVASLVVPYVRLLARAGHPSWTARFTAQVLADPVYGHDMVWRSGRTDAHQEAAVAMWSGAPELAAEVLGIRVQMMRIVVVHTCAEREATAAASATPADWATVEAALVDAVTGMLLAPAGVRAT